MTEEYRSLLISRISKFNFTNYLFLKKAGILSILCILSALAGYFSEIFFLGDTESSFRILTAHFCGFFSGLGPLDGIRAVIVFASPEIILTAVLALAGYTMLSSVISKLSLVLYSVCFGGSISLLRSFLIEDKSICGGASAFMLFTVSKIFILFSLIFSSVLCEDFSYRFCKIFEKNRHPYRTGSSLEYIGIMSSSAGFTVIINTLYLIFQSIQGFTPL